MTLPMSRTRTHRQRAIRVTSDGSSGVAFALLTEHEFVIWHYRPDGSACRNRQTAYTNDLTDTTLALGWSRHAGGRHAHPLNEADARTRVRTAGSSGCPARPRSPRSSPPDTSKIASKFFYGNSRILWGSADQHTHETAGNGWCGIQRTACARLIIPWPWVRSPPALPPSPGPMSRPHRPSGEKVDGRPQRGMFGRLASLQTLGNPPTGDPGHDSTLRREPCAVAGRGAVAGRADHDLGVVGRRLTCTPRGRSASRKSPSRHQLPVVGGTLSA
jgi:hypothetical protein